MHDLTLPSERERLAELETVIANGIPTVIETGLALLEIRDSRLYRENYKSFEDYCKSKWDFSRAHAYRLLEASKITNHLKECLQIGDIPNEGVLREIAPYINEPEEDVQKVWEDTKTDFGPTPTAAQTRGKFQGHFKPEPIKQSKGFPVRIKFIFETIQGPYRKPLSADINLNQIELDAINSAKTNGAASWLLTQFLFDKTKPYYQFAEREY